VSVRDFPLGVFKTKKIQQFFLFHRWFASSYACFHEEQTVFVVSVFSVPKTFVVRSVSSARTRSIIGAAHNKRTGARQFSFSTFFVFPIFLAARATTVMTLRRSGRRRRVLNNYCALPVIDDVQSRWHARHRRDPATGGFPRARDGQHVFISTPLCAGDPCGQIIFY